MPEEIPLNDQSKHLEISKYPNRRYYDKTRSRHLTLEEVYAAIREGFDVHVTDSKTGQDITIKVLAQILLELDPPKLGVFPVPLLHQLLRANQQLVTDFTQKYFSQALSTFLDSQKQAEQYLRQTMGLHTAATPLTDWTKALMWGPFGSNSPASAPATAPAAPKPEAPPPDPNLLAKIAQLQNEIEQMRQQVGSARAKKRPTRQRAKK